MLPTGRANGKTMTVLSRPSTARTLGWLVLIVALMVATPVAAADEDPSAQLNDGSSETSVVDGEPSGEGSYGAAALPQGDCAGGEIYDDGVAENGYSGNPATVSAFDAVMLFTPQAHPAGYETICVAVTSLGGPNLEFTLRFWDDDGAGGQPGTLLAETETLSVDDLPVGLPCRMYEVDVSQLGLVIPEGSVYVGVRWNPMAFPSRFVCSDETPATPLRTGYVNFNDVSGWQATQTVFPSYRALLVRAVQDLTPPQTLIVSGPGQGSVVTEQVATFGYASDEVGSTFECSVDGSAFGACSGPGDTHTTGPLGIGEHVFAVRASDPFGNTDPTPATRNFTVLSADLVGLVDPASGVWHLRSQTGAVTQFFYGNPGDTPFMGDWDCDGVDTPGLFRLSDAFAYLRNSNSQGIADIRFFFGNPSDIPLAGDFNGDGCDTLSLYRPSEQRFYIINALGANEGGLGPAEFSFQFGNPGDKPFVGDFDGDGIDEVGLHRESTGFVYYRNTLTTGIADNQFFFGDPGDRFVSGDWGIVDGTDTPGLFRPGNITFYFRHSNTQGVADSQLVFGQPTWLPVAGVFGID